MPASGVASSAGAASAAGSSGQHERAWESPHSERRRRCSSSGGRSRSGEKRGKDWFPSPARSYRSYHASASSSAASLDAGKPDSAMPPPPARCPGIGGSCPGGDRSAPDHDRPPQPGPSGLGSGLQSLPGAAQSRSGFGGHSSPLLRVRQKTTILVLSTWSIWIGMIRFGLFFASSRSSTVWRNWRV